MRKYCFIFGLFFLLSFKSINGISGEYKVVFDSKFKQFQKSSCYQISIKENKYSKKYFDNEIVEGGITIIEGKNSKKIYYLQDFMLVIHKARKDSSHLPPLGKMIMEVEELSTDTLSFRTTYKRQLNVTINTGKLVRQK